MPHTNKTQKNPEDHQHFSQFAHQWWDPQGPMKPLHDINPIRIQFVQNCLEQYPLEKKILDVGCGAGLFTEAISELQFNTFGIDIDKKLIETASRHAKLSKLDVNYTHGELTPKQQYYPKETFPIISCLEVIEHCSNPFLLLDTCLNILKPNGLLIVSTINRTLSAYLKTILMAEYILKLIPKHTHQYDSFIKPSEIMSWARNHNMQLIKLKGINYQPLTSNANLTDKIDNNFIICLKKSN